MTNADQYERYMLTLINADRADVGAAPFKLEQNLNQAAEDHSEWMLARDVFSHTGNGGSSPTDRMRAADFDFSGRWQSAENIAVQSERGSAGIKDDVADLHTSLMNSPGHYRNLMDPNLKYIGIGIEVGEFNFGSGAFESVIVTQNFANTGGAVDLDRGGSPDSGATGGDDRLIGTDGADVLSGLAGHDVIRAGLGRDVVNGGTGDDKLFGGRDADRLSGNAGNDRLKAGQGEDVLRGGSGTDHLFGRGGNDRFVFAKGDDTDVVHDFANNRDTLDLRGFDFASVNRALDTADQRGDNVVFAMGQGDRLIVHDITMRELSDDILI